MALTTSDQIEIDVRDDAAAMTRLFTLPAPARMDALAEMRGISAFDEGPMKMLKQVHEQGDGFRVDVADPRYPAALKRLVDADAWGSCAASSPGHGSTSDPSCPACAIRTALRWC